MRVVVADDDPTTLAMLQHALNAWGYAATTTSDGLQAWQLLSEGDEPTLAILDWMMPQMDGMELCTRLRKLPRIQPLYIIILTARAKTSDIVKGLGSGADDYVAKPYQNEELRARVDLAARTIKLQSQLAVLAYEDALTGLSNRSRLMQIGADEIVRSRRYERPLSLVLMDVDHFKGINDTYGHAAGDRVLRQFGARLKALIRHTDVPCRLGGDELVVVAPETNLGSAGALAQRILTGAREMSLRLDEQVLGLSLSLGVAELEPGDVTIVDVIARADGALYAAKEAGRGCAMMVRPTGYTRAA